MLDQNIKEKYEEVQSSLENAIDVSDNIELSGDEENVELHNIRKQLNQLNNDFKDEIDKLEKSSEWDKFCMAFFGETNAGKSTIIEALRIVYNEESRREEINKQKNMVQEELEKEEAKYSDLVDSLTQLNDSLTEQKESNTRKIIKAFGLILVGIIIGLLVGYIVLQK